MGQTPRNRMWYFAYERWYNNRKAGNKVRQALWARVCDIVVTSFWGPDWKNWRTK